MLRTGSEIAYPVLRSITSSVPGVACYPQQPVFADVADEILNHFLRPTQDLVLASNELTMNLKPVRPCNSAMSRSIMLIFVGDRPVIHLHHQKMHYLDGVACERVPPTSYRNQYRLRVAQARSADRRTFTSISVDRPFKSGESGRHFHRFWPAYCLALQ